MSTFTDNNNKLKVIVDSIQDNNYPDFPVAVSVMIDEYIKKKKTDIQFTIYINTEQCYHGQRQVENYI